MYILHIQRLHSDSAQWSTQEPLQALGYHNGQPAPVNFFVFVSALTATSLSFHLQMAQKVHSTSLQSQSMNCSCLSVKKRRYGEAGRIHSLPERAVYWLFSLYIFLSFWEKNLSWVHYFLCLPCFTSMHLEDFFFFKFFNYYLRFVRIMKFAVKIEVRISLKPTKLT